MAAIPNAELRFYSWINWNFLTSPQSSDPFKSGINVAIWGSLWVTMIAFLVAVPIGVGAAIYLEEYSTGKSRFDQIVETNINNLAGVPSIIYGMLGLAVFVRILAPLTSGAIFGYGDPATTNGRTILSAGLTLGLLILPLVIINAREAIRAVPAALREASYGARRHPLADDLEPRAAERYSGHSHRRDSGCVARVRRDCAADRGRCVDVHRDRRRTAPFPSLRRMTAQIYQWTSRPQEEFQAPGGSRHHRAADPAAGAERCRHRVCATAMRAGIIESR